MGVANHRVPFFTKDHQSCHADTSAWHQTKQHIANREQRAEIVKHRARMARKSGRPISLDEAARDWINTFAAEWRVAFERRTSERGIATPVNP